MEFKHNSPKCRLTFSANQCMILIFLALWLSWTIPWETFIILETCIWRRLTLKTGNCYFFTKQIFKLIFSIMDSVDLFLSHNLLLRTNITLQTSWSMKMFGYLGSCFAHGWTLHSILFKCKKQWNCFSN